MSSPDGQGTVKAAGQSACLSWQEPKPGWLLQSWRPRDPRPWVSCSAAGWYPWPVDEGDSTDLTQPAGAPEKCLWFRKSLCQSHFAAASNPKPRAELFNHDIMPISSCCLSYKQLGDSRGKESSLPPKSVTKDFHLAESRPKPGCPFPSPTSSLCSNSLG